MAAKTIPADSKAGELAFEIVQRIAERLWTQAQDATGEYIAAEFPGSATTREWHAEGRYHREIRRNGQSML